MPTKPTVYPDWATDDVVDLVSGQSNVEEPSAPKKASGWDRREKPPRQWDNWLNRIQGLWVRWLDGALTPLSLNPTTTNDVPVDGTGHTHEITGFLETDENLSEIAVAGSVAQASARGNIGAQADTEGATQVFSGSSASVDLTALGGGYPGDGWYFVAINEAGADELTPLYIRNGYRSNTAIVNIAQSAGTNITGLSVVQCDQSGVVSTIGFGTSNAGTINEIYKV